MLLSDVFNSDVLFLYLPNNFPLFLFCTPLQKNLKIFLKTQNLIIYLGLLLKQTRPLVFNSFAGLWPTIVGGSWIHRTLRSWSDGHRNRLALEGAIGQVDKLCLLITPSREATIHMVAGNFPGRECFWITPLAVWYLLICPSTVSTSWGAASGHLADVPVWMD